MNSKDSPRIKGARHRREMLRESSTVESSSELGSTSGPNSFPGTNQSPSTTSSLTGRLISTNQKISLNISPPIAGSVSKNYKDSLQKSIQDQESKKFRPYAIAPRKLTRDNSFRVTHFSPRPELQANSVSSMFIELSRQTSHHSGTVCKSSVLHTTDSQRGCIEKLPVSSQANANQGVLRKLRYNYVASKINTGRLKSTKAKISSTLVKNVTNNPQNMSRNRSSTVSRESSTDKSKTRTIKSISVPEKPNDLVPSVRSKTYPKVMLRSKSSDSSHAKSQLINNRMLPHGSIAESASTKLSNEPNCTVTFRAMHQNIFEKTFPVEITGNPFFPEEVEESDKSEMNFYRNHSEKKLGITPVVAVAELDNQFSDHTLHKISTRPKINDSYQQFIQKISPVEISGKPLLPKKFEESDETGYFFNKLSKTNNSAQALSNYGQISPYRQSSTLARDTKCISTKGTEKAEHTNLITLDLEMLSPIKKSSAIRHPPLKSKSWFIDASVESSKTEVDMATAYAPISLLLPKIVEYGSSVLKTEPRSESTMTKILPPQTISERAGTFTNYSSELAAEFQGRRFEEPIRAMKRQPFLRTAGDLLGESPKIKPQLFRQMPMPEAQRSVERNLATISEERSREENRQPLKNDIQERAIEHLRSLGVFPRTNSEDRTTRGAFAMRSTAFPSFGFPIEISPGSSISEECEECPSWEDLEQSVRESLDTSKRTPNVNEQFPNTVLYKYNVKNRFSIEECTICLIAFRKGDNVRRLPCLHLFHRGCIDRWLVIQPACPNCLFNV